MAVSDIDAVLEFLRKNGLSESESALMEDILDKSQVGSFDFERFMFPMVSPPPPLKIPTAAHEGLVEENPGPIGSCSASSDNDDDEFVSLGRSSTTDLCSSDFTNPYGIRIATGANSRESSDRMSQFGTARDYYDFDMQNDLYWHEENYSLTPHLSDNLDPYGIEDKYEIEENHSNNYLDKSLSFEVESMKNDAKTSDFYGFRTENVEFEDDFERKEKTGCFDEEIDGKIDDLIGSDEVSMDDNKEEEYEVFDLRIIHRKNRTGFEENRDLPIILNAIIAGRYFVTEYLGSAAFSKVVQAHDLQTGIEVCLKIIKNNKDFFDQSLDEIKLLKFVNKHDPNDERHILRLYDYFYHQEHLFIVCELLRANLYEFQKYNRESGGEPYFTMKRIQVIARQCLEALDYLHSLGIIHCDLKPENILIKSYRRCEIKVIDLGSSCFNSDHLCFYVQSRSYRAPEVILGLPYDHKIDLWSLGCILAELCSGEVLFPNEEVAMLLGRVIGLLGPIDLDMLTKGQETDKYFTNEYDLYHINEDTKQMEYIIPDESSSLEHHLQVTDTLFIDFLRDLLEINPNRRPTAREALGHPWLSHSYDFDSLYL